MEEPILFTCNPLRSLLVSNKLLLGNEGGQSAAITPWFPESIAFQEQQRDWQLIQCGVLFPWDICWPYGWRCCSFPQATFFWAETTFSLICPCVTKAASSLSPTSLSKGCSHGPKLNHHHLNSVSTSRTVLLLQVPLKHIQFRVRVIGDRGRIRQHPKVHQRLVHVLR